MQSAGYSDITNMILFFLCGCIIDYLVFAVVDNLIKLIVKWGYSSQSVAWKVEIYILFLLCWLIWEYHHLPLFLLVISSFVAYMVYRNSAQSSGSEHFRDWEDLNAADNVNLYSPIFKSVNNRPKQLHHRHNAISQNVAENVYNCPIVSEPHIVRTSVTDSFTSKSQVPTVGNMVRPELFSTSVSPPVKEHGPMFPNHVKSPLSTQSVYGRGHYSLAQSLHGTSPIQGGADVPSYSATGMTSNICTSTSGSPVISPGITHTPTSPSPAIVNTGNSIKPLGLVNQGNNWCFINCILQCLCHTPQLVDRLEESKARDTTLLSSLLAIWKACLRKDSTCDQLGLAVDPTNFCRLASSVMPVVNRNNSNSQEDAAEFLVELVNLIHEESNSMNIDHHSARVSEGMRGILAEYNNIETDLHVLQLISQYAEEYGQQTAGEDMSITSRLIVNISQLKWLHYKIKNVSAIDDMFVGQQIDIYECTSCQHMTFNTYTYNQLMLPLPCDATYPVSSIPLHHLISSTFNKELIDNSLCSCCHSIQQERRKCSYLERLPECLTIQLLRSTYNHGIGASKSHLSVDIPLHNLDMSQYSLTNPGHSLSSRCYSLYAVCIHYGAGQASGHFQVVARYSRDNTWYTLDDNVVNVVGNDTDMYKLLQEHHIKTNAYLLFYTLSGS